MSKLLIFLLLIAATVSGFFSRDLYTYITSSTDLKSPFVSEPTPIPKPLLEYSIPALRNRSYQSSTIVLEEQTADTEAYTTFNFSYTTLGRKMTGQLNIPRQMSLGINNQPKIIILVRGFVPQEIYQPGVGTKNAAIFFAERGYITISQDFFGYGGSDPEPSDTWQARFEKPATLIELIKTIETKGIPLVQDTTTNFQDPSTVEYKPSTNIGIWAHSNGGQITLAALEILSRPIPTTLWAPVTAPFPYSVLYFTDEELDEGKSFRKSVNQFEELYDVFDFTLTKHLNHLTGPLQLHHGTADEAAPIIWSDEFVQKITLENKRRQELLELADVSTPSAIASKSATVMEPIVIEYARYPNTDHNMKPNWNEAIQKDLVFFETYIK